MSQEFLRYKGRPLVRSGDTLYYGSMGDKCVAHLQIKSNKQDHGLNMADKVVIQLISHRRDPAAQGPYAQQS